MSDSYRALSSDFYINQKLSLKLDLPRERQTILDLFDRVRRQFPSMNQFRRYRDEVALEADQNAAEHRWVAIRNNNIRSGVVNPERLGEGDASEHLRGSGSTGGAGGATGAASGYALHRHVLEVAPFFMSISPLDVDYVELLYGFDMLADRNHDEIVYEALVSQSPLARVLDVPGSRIVDCQPLFGVVLEDADSTGGIEVNFEIKTRSGSRQGRDEPISIYLILRKYGPVNEIKQLPEILSHLIRYGEELVDTRVVPNIVVPIRDAIGSSR
jgi:hypothetical protein